MTSGGEPISSSSGRAVNQPRTAAAAPQARLSPIAVWTVSSTSAFFPAPVNCATATQAPTERPMKMLMTRLISAPVEPTAARAVLPANLPTTTMSAALYKSCRTPESISGREKRSIFPSSGPLVMSMS